MNKTIRLPLPLLVLSASGLLLLLGLPLLVLILRVLNPGFLPSLLSTTVTEALRLSLLTSAISLLLTVLLGTPLAYLLARYTFPGQRILDTLVDLPIVLPPTVAGLGLLLTFGRRGFIGAYLNEVGITLAFTTVAVVMAQLFVASPLYIRAAKAGFSTVGQSYEGAALTLGASRWRTFRRVTLPLAAPHLTEGIILTWARAIGEFGATLVFAGSFRGLTQTMPLAIYAALESDLNAALVLSAILSLVAFSLLAAFRQFVKL